MEKKTNKLFIIFGVALISLSVFITFNFDLIAGILSLVLGILLIAFNKSKKHIIVNIFAILLFIYLLLSILFDLLALLIGKVYIGITTDFGIGNALTISFSQLFYRILDNGPEILLNTDIETIIALIILVSDMLISLASSFIFLILLIMVNVLTKNKAVRIITSIVVGFASICLIASNVDNLFITSIANILINSRGFSLISIIMNGPSIEELLSSIYIVSLLDKFNFTYILTILIAFVTLVFACVSATAHGKCKKEK